MVKARISRAAKKPTESEVKLENQEENQKEDSSDQFGRHDNEKRREKMFDDHRIIKEFLMKRKLLMKALKLKQKQKDPKLLTLQSFQNNEGSPTSQQYTPSSYASQDKSETPSKQTSNMSSFTQEIEQNKIEVQEPYEESNSKLNVGVQTKIISLRKYAKQSQPVKNGQEKYTVDYLIKEYENKERNKENGVRARKRKNFKDIESIKNQINTLFRKDHETQFSSNSQKIQSSYDSLSDSEKQRSQYQDVLNIMKGLNEKIQSYYDSKPLKKIIFTQLQSKVRRRNKEKQRKRKASANLKSKEIKKHNKYQSSFIQTEEFEKKLQKKRYLSNKDQKIKLKINKKSSARINERFQILITSKNESELKKSSQTKMPSKNNLSDDDQNNVCEIFEDSDPTETPFYPMAAWNTEFGNIQLMLLEKYDFLGAYMTMDKKVGYKRILKNIKAENKENSDVFPIKNKTDDTPSIKSSSDLYQLIDVRNSPKHNNIGNSQKKNAKPIQIKPLKQLQLEGQSQDEFGKSFDLHLQFHSQTTPEQHFDDLNNSNVISRTLNLSFYSSTTGKKSGTNNERGNNNVNHLFLSHSESLTIDSDQSQHLHKGPFSKVRVIENEGLGFKGQKEKQYLYMSEEIQ